MPHMWCPGCGIGIAVSAFLNALKQSRYGQDDVVLVSGIGCAGRVAGYVKLDSFHTTHGRAIPFAEGLKAASPKTKVVVFSGEGDLMSIGGNHFIHAGRKNMSITILCVNNLNYAMTGGQVSPTTPAKAITATAPFGSFCQPFNLPFIAEAAGAVYVARWTVFHVRQLQKAILEAIHKKGMSFVEIISPCPTLYERRNQMGTALSRMNFYRENTVIKNGASTKDAVMDLDKPFIVGKFVDDDSKLTYLEAMNEYYDTTFSCDANYHTYTGSKI
ncbi:MAG: 2-oxoacid:ferredoxin oxidoreductase subunit beta [Oligoflexia bacterium]|nr:2-oxoacid:ferredoxin oxidoreductase subunit beta [Oligoflexia bacterium]